MLDNNPARQGITNRQRPRIEQRPFESWDDLRPLPDRLGRRLGPLVLFAAATGLRPSECLALELRDIDLIARVVYVRRAYRNGRIKCPKTDASPTMIDRHSGHLAKDGRKHAIDPLDTFTETPRVHAVDAR
jgi:integrase